MPLRSCSSRIGAACHGSTRGVLRRRLARADGPAADPDRPACRGRSRAAARQPRPRRAAAPADHVADAEDRPVRRVDRQVVVVAVGDRAGASTRFERSTAPVTFSRCAGVIETPGVKPNVHGEVRRVVHGDQHAAVAHELLQVGQPAPAQARADVVGRVDLAEVRRQLGRLPRNRIAVHRHAGDDRCARGAADGREEDDVVLRRADRASFATSCVLM